MVREHCVSNPAKFLPQRHSNPLAPPVRRFPNRGDSGSPQAPVGAFYWWGGRQQLWPNVEYAKQALMYAQTAYFVAVLMTQWANLVICKTRKLSVFEQVRSAAARRGLQPESRAVLFREEAAQLRKNVTKEYCLSVA